MSWWLILKAVMLSASEAGAEADGSSETMKFKKERAFFKVVTLRRMFVVTCRGNRLNMHT